MNEDEEKAALIALVAPWLPDATVDTLYIEERCGCYSEWTQEHPRYEVTFKAKRPTGETDRKLSDVVRAIEGLVTRFAHVNHNFSGCSGCCGEDGDLDNPPISCWVRIIPMRDAVDPAAGSTTE